MVTSILIGNQLAKEGWYGPFTSFYHIIKWMVGAVVLGPLFWGKYGAVPRESRASFFRSSSEILFGLRQSHALRWPIWATQCQPLRGGRCQPLQGGGDDGFVCLLGHQKDVGNMVCLDIHIVINIHKPWNLGGDDGFAPQIWWLMTIFAIKLATLWVHTIFRFFRWWGSSSHPIGFIKPGRLDIV